MAVLHSKPLSIIRPLENITRDYAIGQLRSYMRLRIPAIGIEEITTAPRSSWQNPFCERLIGSVRRDCLNHAIILGESHLRKILARYFDYYRKYRTHLSLDKDAPERRPIQDAKLGEVTEIPEVGGLHHHYERRAA
jgi:putative transposase